MGHTRYPARIATNRWARLMTIRMMTIMAREFSPLSHDAFIILCELEALGNKCNVDDLKAAGKRRGIKGVDTAIFEIVKADLALIAAHTISYHPKCDNKELQPPKNYVDQEALKSRAYISKAIISRAIKSTHAGYQAVVQGKKPRFSNITAYAERHLSRQDVPQFNKMIRDMDDAERVRFDHRLARLVNRGG